MFVENLDVYARAGAVTAYVFASRVYIPDRNVTIQFVPVVHNPFISAIEVLEVPNTAAPITIPTAAPFPVPSASPLKTTYTEVVRINAGGETFVDSMGNTWSNDTYFQGNNSFVGNEACESSIDIVNTIDDALFCSERYFKGNNTAHSSYEIPVNEAAEYLLRLYFSETVSPIVVRYSIHRTVLP